MSGSNIPYFTISDVEKFLNTITDLIKENVSLKMDLEQLRTKVDIDTSKPVNKFWRS